MGNLTKAIFVATTPRKEPAQFGPASFFAAPFQEGNVIGQAGGRDQ
jgi:hypothetical protein